MNLSESITQYIQRNTDDGKPLVDFLIDTMQGRTPYAKFAHQFKAVELLTFYGGFVPDQLPTLDNLPARNDASANPKSGKKAKKRKVTEKELLNYDIIRMIKQDTRNGEMLVDLLIHVAIEGKMSNSRRFISPSTRMRAAQELLTRGFGAVSPRRLPSGKNEGLGATISKRIRKDTDNGREAAAYLMDIVIGNPPKSKPSKRKRFTPHRRVLAACELLRRLCDIRTDHITPEHIQAYWTSQTPIDARAREAKANSRPDINRTGIDKATALAAMATKPPENNKSAADNDANADKPAVQDPFPLRGKARMGAPPENTPTTDGEARSAAAAAEPSPTETQADAVSNPPDNTPAPSEQSNTAKSAETPAANNAAEAPKDPFPPRGKARMGASPDTDATETQADAVNNERDSAAAEPSPTETQAIPAINEPPPTASVHKSADNTAASEPSNNANTAVSDERDSTAIAANPTMSDERETPAIAAKPASNEPPPNAAANPHTNASSHKSANTTTAASEPSNTASLDNTADKPATPTTPSHPTPFASKSPQVEAPKPTRRQRQKANKRKQRRAQRKARSP